jgi:acyl carrier protein
MKNIEKIIFEITDNLDKKKFDETKSFKDLGIDSLDLFSIISKIETKFKIKIKDKELDKIDSPKKLYIFLKKKNVI